MTKRGVSLFLTLVLLAVARPVSGSDDVNGEITRVGDAVHVEFTGRKSWNYDIKKTDQSVTINLPPLAAKTKAALTAWSDAFVQSIKFEPGPDGGDLVTFKLGNDNIEHFDYISDQPSRLIVDFYKNKGAPKKSIAKSVQKAPVENIVPVQELPPKKMEREVASESVAGDKDSGNDVGIHDSADPEFNRFQILSADIQEDSVIASRGNIYLQYPILDDRQDILKEIVDNPPIYEIKSEDTDENKKARLILTLYG